MLTVCATHRLALRRLTVEDAPFIFELVNNESWLRFIGDKGVRTLADAQKYILNGPVEMYTRFGFGLWLVETRDENSTPIGICGLIKREALNDVDLGFAFLPEFWGKGYAFEAASAAMIYGKMALKLKRIAAITAPDNHRSAKLLVKLGFQFERMMQLNGSGDVAFYTACGSDGA
ncbi:GNAT family N-acetyltransferase [Frigoriglobus tundricola]|uniref:Acetyltransferase, GNAT family n=1 Tax=Frigoriglobus tundricola TaxID=2774151 RepID=A0A6M5YSI0_9BACT|nr:GNAT family N-acetyltransferase [Frigoriglobus tundricola]QJW96958.1 Acetyltransferase, GNAT family [Frigoriglobus tundricola]